MCLKRIKRKKQVVVEIKTLSEAIKSGVTMGLAHSLLFKHRYVPSNKLNCKTEVELLNQFRAAGLVVDEASLIRLAKELDRHLIAVLAGDVSPDRLREICPCCLQTSLVMDRERDEVCCANPDCSDAGVVLLDLWTPDESLPFDVTINPSSDLATGRSIGTPASNQLLYETLKKNGFTHKKVNGSNYYTYKVFCQKYPDLAAGLESAGYVCFGDQVFMLENTAGALGVEQKRVYVKPASDIGKSVVMNRLLSSKELRRQMHMDDLPLRVMTVKNLVAPESVELDQILKKGSAMLCAFGLDKNYVFGGTLGKYIRRAYHFVQDYKLGVPKRCVAASAFVYSLVVADKLLQVNPCLWVALNGRFPSVCSGLVVGGRLTVRPRALLGVVEQRALNMFVEKAIVSNFSEPLFGALDGLNGALLGLKVNVELSSSKFNVRSEVLCT